MAEETTTTTTDETQTEERKPEGFAAFAQKFVDAEQQARRDRANERVQRSRVLSF